MKRILVAITFFLTLGINTKGTAQGRYAAINTAEPATHNSIASANNYETHNSAPAIASVKQTPVATSRSSAPASRTTATPPAINLSGTIAALHSAGGTHRNPAATISAAARYNPVTKHNYPYYTTPITKYKSEHHGSFEHKRFHAREPFFFYPDFFLVYEGEDVYDEMLMADNDNIPKGSSVLNTSLDGYVVYSGDTISGVVTVTDKNIYLEQPLDGRHVKGYTFPNTDNNVLAVAVFEGNNSLYLGRASGGGKLSRVIHSGKLTVYDDKYNFFTPDNVHRAKMTLAYGGQVKSPKSFLAADSKQLLIDAINAAYGLQLEAKNYSWNQLLIYLDKLD